ncbi:ParB N-terminal domain-containing protein [Streptomyces sp. NPDC014870]|uniref:ParB N-terminal domain-containing protein n=1 Tax=Streptomyces sp. NPDC014870 TaxID=3364925 RepID=UPI0036FA20BA
MTMTTKTQAGVQTAPAPWPTITTAELLAHPGNVRSVEAPADLLADVKANGVQEPLYVVRTHGDVPQIVDGFLRLAAALAAGQESVPVTQRPVIRIDALTPHPKNAREELGIEAAFVESLRSEGCRIPVKVQRLDGGTIQVIDGHRRYHGAKEAGLTHLPYEWDDERDEAGQFLDMITTAQHRKELTPVEMNAAMFSAAEAGAQVGRIAKAAGVRQKDVRAVVKVKSHEALNAVVGTSYAWTFDHMAALSEFVDDVEALAAITEAAAKPDADERDIDWAIAVQRTKRDKREKAEKHRAALEEAGERIRDAEELPERAVAVWRLRGINAEEHAQCKGNVWVFDDTMGDRYEPYCTAPGLYGHVTPGGSTGGGQTKSHDEQEAERAARAAVKKGNLDWDAAEAVRRKWLTDLIKRRNLSKATANALVAHVSEALLAGTWGVSDDLNKDATTEILAELVGLTGHQGKVRNRFAEILSKDPRRAAQYQFAAIAAVREKSATRAAWRTDGQQSDWVRTPTRAWFKVLNSLGYQLTPIEQSVADGEPYDPSKKTPAAITTGEATQAAADSEAEEAPTPEAEADEHSSDDEEATA